MRVSQKLASALLTIVLSVSFLGASGDHARFTDLGHRMMCVCGCNQILLECNHVGCTYSDRMRDQLMSAVRQNSDDETVMQSFVHEYGNTVLAAPSGHGFDRMAWIMPFVVLFAGSITAGMVVRHWKHGDTSPISSPASSSLSRYREQARRETEL